MLINMHICLVTVPLERQLNDITVHEQVFQKVSNLWQSAWATHVQHQDTCFCTSVCCGSPGIAIIIQPVSGTHHLHHSIWQKLFGLGDYCCRSTECHGGHR